MQDKERLLLKDCCKNECN